MAPILEDERVSKILNHLQANGIPRKRLRDYTVEEIETLVPQHLTDVDAFTLKVALRKEKSLHNQFFDVIGRVTANKKNMEKYSQHGSCVLVGRDGLSITALHILNLEDNEQIKKKRKGKQHEDEVVISVVYPHTTYGKLRFRVTVVDKDPILDLALLKPMKPLARRYDSLKYFSDWALNPPRANDRVILFSFPLIVDREFDLEDSGQNDIPSMHEGKVTLVPQSANYEVLTSYLGFQGCSGGLVVYPDSDLGPCAFGIHLMSIHESDNLDTIDLQELNKIAHHKAHYGVFSYGVHDFLKRSRDLQSEGEKKSLILKARNDRDFVNKMRKLACNGLSVEEIFKTLGCAKLPIQKSIEKKNHPYKGKTIEDCLPLRYINIPIERRKARDLNLFDGGFEKKNGKANNVEVVDLFGPWPGLDLMYTKEQIGKGMGSRVSRWEGVQKAEGRACQKKC